jgi:hypothetical protein
MFSVTLSHLKELHNFWHMMDAITLFEKKKIIHILLWIMDGGQSHLGLGAHLRRWHRKQIIKGEM